MAHPRNWAAIERQEARTAEAKIVSRIASAERAALWRRRGLRVGFNGCFDLLHRGICIRSAQARRNAIGSWWASTPAR